ncbi:hypothetical protein NIES2100_04880 [Calothrix sp. NIES-2100]|nr:hypothetical protein NIES2100_04880 [Calothrix sp. NIES-2100]
MFDFNKGFTYPVDRCYYFIINEDEEKPGNYICQTSVKFYNPKVLGMYEQKSFKRSFYWKEIQTYQNL